MIISPLKGFQKTKSETYIQTNHFLSWCYKIGSWLIKVVIACWRRAVDLYNLCPELHLIGEVRKIVDWLQFSWKSMCNRTVMQACHMTLVQQPWWCCTWSYQLFLTWLLRQRRITFFLAPYSPSASLYTPLAWLDISLVTVTQWTSQAK